ncbi:hypothetical protein EDD21DRAFT_361690 [Dissophora ornata]|nr:hypothetical protein EDD21DRAFT_361690 [Dissophora ornata]
MTSVYRAPVFTPSARVATPVPVPALVLSPATRPWALDLPEILSLIGQFLSQRDALSCVLVSRTWHQAFQPILWGHVETANGISPEDIERHAHFIRTLALADLKGLEKVLERCTRLDTLILWPDTFEDEEDEEDDDDEDENEGGEEDGENGVGEVNMSGYGSGGKEVGEESLFGMAEPNTASSSVRHQEHERQQPPPTPHPMEQPEPGSRRKEHVVNEHVHVYKGQLLGKEGDTKVRRDSGVGDDTVGLAHSEANTARLGISEAMPTQQQKNFIQRSHTPLTKLLLRNRNLTRLEVYVERKSPGGSFWRALAASASSPPGSFCPCPRLSAFQSLVNLQVYKHIKPFLQMCTRLESLDLEHCSLRQLDSSYYTTELHFPRMKELKFSRIRDTSLHCQLLIMKQCPELRSLEWRVPRLGFPVEEFCETLREGCWPKLSTLALPDSRLNDSELARILWCTNTADNSNICGNTTNRMGSAAASAVGGLTRFEVRRSDFGAESFRALKERGHLWTLQSLDLYQCQGLDSRMTMEILRGCPLLESFDGHKLFARDILADKRGRRAGVPQQQHDWVCKGMKYLDLHITGFASDPEQDERTHWQVFEQLARLDQLVYLSVGGRNSSLRTATTPYPPTPSPSATATTSSPLSASYISSAVSTRSGGLDLRLRSGLGQLKTLKRLRALRFTGQEQEMTEEDVVWMIENLPDLKVVQGLLHTDPEEQAKLERVLERGKISTWTMYNNEKMMSQRAQNAQK